MQSTPLTGTTTMNFWRTTGGGLMQSTPLTGTTTSKRSPDMSLLWMQSTPLTGTTTSKSALVCMQSRCNPHPLRGQQQYREWLLSQPPEDAIHTPYGDNNLNSLSFFALSSKMQSTPLTGTTTVHHSSFLSGQTMQSTPLTGTTTLEPEVSHTTDTMQSTPLTGTTTPSRR